ncbi:MAG: hypothetical protein WCI73_18260, partial [Phycisphaerae bacterium]
MTAKTVAKQILADLSSFTGQLLAKRPADLAIEITVPTVAAAREYFNANPPCDLTGKIVISNPALNVLVELRPIMPVGGVFFRHGPHDIAPATFVWPTCMQEAAGLRYLKKNFLGDDGAYWRLGLNDGGYIEGPVGASDGESVTVRRAVFLGPLHAYSSIIQPDLSTRVIWPVNDEGQPHINRLRKKTRWRRRSDTASDVHLMPNPVWRNIAALASGAFGEKLLTEEFDLTHKVLGDYWFCLRASLPQCLARILQEHRCDKDTPVAEGQKIQDLMSGRGPFDPSVARLAWSIIGKQEAAIAVAISTPRAGALEHVEIANPVDAISSTTQFAKLTTRVPEHLPAWRRQNHPSFEGYVCPVQTPESTRVGISLFLARGAKVESGTGRLLHEGIPNRATDVLGFAASLVPFFHHNDGARNMMAAKNLRQAVPIAAPDVPWVSTTGESK